MDLENIMNINKIVALTKDLDDSCLDRLVKLINQGGHRGFDIKAYICGDYLLRKALILLKASVLLDILINKKNMMHQRNEMIDELAKEIKKQISSVKAEDVDEWSESLKAEGIDGAWNSFVVTFKVSGLFIDPDYMNHLPSLDDIANGVKSKWEQKFDVKLSEYKAFVYSYLTSLINGEKSSQKKGGCYIATCVYGSYDCPEVWTLRRFRDDNLATNIFGRSFIHVYYSISPILVNLFGNKKWFQNIWKLILTPFVNRLQKMGFSDKPYNDRNW